MNNTLPALPGVNENTLKNFLEALAGECVNDAGIVPELKIVQTKGRHVHVRASFPGIPEDRSYITEIMRIYGEHIRTDGNDIVIAIKTDAQLDADQAAFDLDAQNKVGMFCSSFKVDTVKPAKRQSGRKAPTGTSAEILELLKAGTKTRDQLVKLVEAVHDKDGKNRTRRYVDRAVEKLVDSRRITETDEGVSLAQT